MLTSLVRRRHQALPQRLPAYPHLVYPADLARQHVLGDLSDDFEGFVEVAVDREVATAESGAAEAIEMPDVWFHRISRSSERQRKAATTIPTAVITQIWIAFALPGLSDFMTA